MNVFRVAVPVALALAAATSLSACKGREASDTTTSGTTSSTTTTTTPSGGAYPDAHPASAAASGASP